MPGAAAACELVIVDHGVNFAPLVQKSVRLFFSCVCVCINVLLFPSRSVLFLGTSVGNKTARSFVLFLWMKTKLFRVVETGGGGDYFL